jgi:hypothetical protein
MSKIKEILEVAWPVVLIVVILVGTLIITNKKDHGR